MPYQSALYEGPVVHDRARPKHHRLSYRVFSLLLDIDELPELDRAHSLFGYNRWAPISFWDRDHGTGLDESLRLWVEDQLRNAGLTPDGGPLRILSYPRIFGYAFNPLTVYFSYCRDGTLTAVLYEVSNTFKERHTYVIPVADPANAVIRQSCDKDFYVSPFLPMACRYHFRIAAPAQSVKIAIRQEDHGGPLFAASFSGRRSAFSNRALATALSRYPTMTLKIIVGIHWEAFRLWLKGLPIYRHQPAATAIGTSIIKASAPNRKTGKAA
jgi:uncharacterized protein